MASSSAKLHEQDVYCDPVHAILRCLKRFIKTLRVSQSSPEPDGSTTTSDPEDIISELGDLPPEAILTKKALANMFSRHPASIMRAVDRGELPTPIDLLGKTRWTVKAVREHIGARLEEAQREAEAAEERFRKHMP